MRSDKELLEAYMLGFNDELSAYHTEVSLDLKYSYELGRNHAVLGDDIRSFDNLTNEEILKQIRDNESKC